MLLCTLHISFLPNSVYVGGGEVYTCTAAAQPSVILRCKLATGNYNKSYDMTTDNTWEWCVILESIIPEG